MINNWLKLKVEEKRFNEEKAEIYRKAIATRYKGDFEALLDNRIECLLFELAYPDYKDYD